MTDPSSSPAARIADALARIEHALEQRDDAYRRLTERHAALRARAADAVTALDTLIGRRHG